MAVFADLKRDKKFNSILFLRFSAVSLALGAAWILLSDAETICSGIQSGMSLCVEVVIPSLFPFMVFTTFLTLSGLADIISRTVSPVTRYLFRLPRQAGAAVLMSFIGGFPVGGRMTAKLIQNKSVSPEDGQRMLCFCINAGPSFILTAVGVQMFGNQFIGIMMLCAHILASCTVGLLSSFGKPVPPKKPNSRVSVKIPFIQALIQAVIDSANGMMILCSFIILFSGVTAWLEPIVMRFGENARLSLGILEVTKGCLQSSAFPGLVGELTVVFLLSFSGLSVIAQVLAGFTAEGLSIQPVKVILWRIVNGICAVGWYFAIRAFWGKFFLKAEPVFLRISQQRPSLASRPMTLPLTFCLIAVCAITILTAENSFSSSAK
jgi:sporulation integral membrane protein YlbJ